jgi:hypothetical protein
MKTIVPTRCTEEHQSLLLNAQLSGATAEGAFALEWRSRLQTVPGTARPMEPERQLN